MAKTATKTTAKTAKTAATKATLKTKAPAAPKLSAKEKMANRKRMYFGPAYMNAVIGEFCTDAAKMLQHAVHLKVSTASALKKLSVETLRTRLAAAIMEKPEGAEPFSLKLQ